MLVLPSLEDEGKQDAGRLVIYLDFPIGSCFPIGPIGFNFPIAQIGSAMICQNPDRLEFPDRPPMHPDRVSFPDRL